MVTSGAISKRLDRLERAGWVTRSVSAEDARARTVSLTAAGRELIDGLFEQHMANEHRLVSGLNDLERTRLANLLEQWGRHLGV